MATPKQDQAPLNGAYYGPSIPPQQPPRYRRRRSCCFFTTLLKFIIGIVVILGIAALVFWLVVRPNKIKFYVVTADLKQFDLNTNANTLNYNLDLTMVVRNPNKRIGIYYDKLDATASYEGERFSWVSLPKFYQGHKNTTTLNPTFRGESVMVGLNRFEIDRFNQEKNNGVFYIDVKIYARIRFKVGAIKTRRVKPEIECDLRIPLASNGTTLGRGFESTRCDIDF